MLKWSSPVLTNETGVILSTHFSAATEDYLFDRLKIDLEEQASNEIGYALSRFACGLLVMDLCRSRLFRLSYTE